VVPVEWLSDDESCSHGPQAWREGTNLKVVARPGIRSSCSSAQFTPLPNSSYTFAKALCIVPAHLIAASLLFIP
jgi:hypothetical protein